MYNDQRHRRVTRFIRFWPKGDKSRMNYRIKRSHVYGSLKRFRNLSCDLGMVSIPNNTTQPLTRRCVIVIVCYIRTSVCCSRRFSPVMTTISFTVFTNLTSMPSPCDCILCLCESKLQGHSFGKPITIGPINFMNLVIHVRFIRPIKSTWHLSSILMRIKIIYVSIFFLLNTKCCILWYMGFM